MTSVAQAVVGSQGDLSGQCKLSRFALGDLLCPRLDVNCVAGHGAPPAPSICSGQTSLFSSTSSAAHVL